MDIFISRLKSTYANWRISPTVEELRSYNTTDSILLTFDDFASATRLDEILQILQRENVKAVFFLVGEWASKNPLLVEKIKRAGHWVGNHTKTHANLLRLNKEEIQAEILGGPCSTLLRPPFGKYNKRIRKIAQELGYKICYWTTDSDDWQGISKEEIVLRATRNIHKGACILLHLHAAYTVDALPEVIQEIRKKGYTLCNTGKELTA